MKEYKYKIKGAEYSVKINEVEGNMAKVEVNGIAYDVRYESKNVATSPLTRKVAGPVAPQVQLQQPTQSSATTIKAPLPGTISSINVKVGDEVKRGDTLLVMEAMKMDNNIMASSNGVVKAIHVTVGQSVSQDDVLVDLG